MSRLISRENLVKNFSYLSYYLRLDKLHRLANRGGVTVIFYHDIVERSPIPETKLFVDENNFWEHLNEIQKRYEIISFTDLLKGSVPKKNPLILTFDGYSKSFVKIAEKLSKREVKALFYLQTEPILKGEPHFHQKLYWLFRNLKQVHVKFKCGHIDFEADLTDDTLQNTLKAGRFLDVLYEQPNAHELIDDLAAQYGVDLASFNKKFAPMAPEEVHLLAGLEGIEVGSHSHTHPNLSKLDEVELERELRISKDLLESWTGRYVIHFCYPYPSGDGNTSIFKCLRDVGYKTATTTVRAIFFPNNTSQWPYSIPRFCFSNVPFANAQGQILGIDRFGNYLQAVKENWKIR
ncbi:MAG: polysaccharide deacetylase family protein [Deltaproteobacteria bacterium]|nr:polysaccharide deacetylase family protein [Deltaproteobacteria bacterium]